MTHEADTARPLPVETELMAPYWDALRRRSLVVQRCRGCQKFRWPPEVACYECGSRDYGWEPVSGRATLYTWTIAHPPLLPYFRERAPWPVAVVQLEEGPRLVTNLIGVAPEQYEIGMPLVVDFEDIGEGVSLAAFRPV